MTEFLVKRFVKDYADTEDEQVRTAYGFLAGLTGICCNVLLFGAKLLLGLLIHSISVTADAFNNLSDVASSLIGFLAVKMAGKPADEEHPFGHGRVEYIAAFAVAFLVIQVGFSLFQTSISKILHPEAMVFQPVSIFILLFSVCLKLWMGFFYRKLGKKINSSVLAAACVDSLGDAASTLAILFSVLVYGIWGFSVDGIAGLLVSLAVMWTGVKIAKDALSPLIGEPISPELYRKITEFVESYEGILGSHDLIVHNYGPLRSMASIHAEVPGDSGVQECHELIEAIEKEALAKLNLLLVIHMDPIEIRDARVAKFRSMVGEVLEQADPRLGFHDFRMVEGKNQINLIFDLVVPREYDRKKREGLKGEVIKRVREKDNRCFLILTVESGFEVEK